MAALHGLTRVQFRVSAVIRAPVDSTWGSLRSWTALDSWFSCDQEMMPITTTPVAGEPTQVGGMRCIKIGHGQMFEQLVGLDDAEHILRWKVVSHPDTINPFKDASFVNYISTLRLHPITVGDATFLDWTGELFTEPAFADAMQIKLRRWYEAGILCLQAHLAQLQLAAPVQLAPQPPLDSIGLATPLQAAGGLPPLSGGFPAASWPAPHAGLAAAGITPGAQAFKGPTMPIGTSQAQYSSSFNAAAPLPPLGGASQPAHPAATASASFSMVAPAQQAQFPGHSAAAGGQAQETFNVQSGAAAFSTGLQVPASAGQPFLMASAAAFSAAPLGSQAANTGLPQSQTFAAPGFTGLPQSQAFGAPGFTALQQSQGFAAPGFSALPQSQAFAYQGARGPQSLAPPSAGIQTQAAFLAESLRRTRLSQSRQQQQQQPPLSAHTRLRNVPSFSDGLQALYDQADEAQAARRGRQSEPGTKPGSTVVSPTSITADPGPTNSATDHSLSGSLRAGAQVAHGGFGSLTQVTEAAQTALRAALRAEAAQQSGTPPPQLQPDSAAPTPAADAPKNPFANAFANAPPRAKGPPPGSAAAAWGNDRVVVGAPDLGLLWSMQHTPEGPGPPAVSESDSSNATMSWTDRALSSSGPASSRALGSSKSSQYSGGSDAYDSSRKSSQGSGGSGGSGGSDAYESRNSSLDSNESTTEEEPAQPAKRRSFEFDRPVKVLGRRSFEEATLPHPPPTNPKTQRTGDASETLQSSNPKNIVKEGAIEATPQALLRFSPFAASSAGSQSSSQSRAGSDQGSDQGSESSHGGRVGLSRLSPFAAAVQRSE